MATEERTSKKAPAAGSGCPKCGSAAIVLQAGGAAQCTECHAALVEEAGKGFVEAAPATTTTVHRWR